MKQALLILPLFVAPASADDLSTPAGGHPGLMAIDWMILFLYAAATIGLGWYYSRRQQNTREYFVGSGRMNPVLIGVSLFATLLSTISYLALPGEAAGRGPAYLTILLAYPLIFLIVGFVMLPVYMKQRVSSAYELLEERLGLGARLLGTFMFLLLRLVWMSLLIYLASKAMTVMLGVDDKWVPLIVLITGAVSIAYTTLGGLRAVVITDLMQTILLYGGALMVIAFVTSHFGGFSWFPTQWQDGWDTQPIISLDPSTRVTVVGSILTGLIWYIATSGGDQVSVQRFMATRDAKAARLALAVQLGVAALVGVTLVLVGFALLRYFQSQPELLPRGKTLREAADDLFPRFIAFHLPPGISGLVVAAMFAAAMSSIDSGVNSITAVVSTDLIDRFSTRPQSDRHRVILARWLALTIGTIVLMGSTLIPHVPGNITAVTNKTVNLLTVPIFCLFFLALFVRFANPVGAWVGVSCSTATTVLIAFSGPIFGQHPGTGEDPISFQWIGPTALVVGITTGVGASALSAAARRRT